MNARDSSQRPSGNKRSIVVHRPKRIPSLAPVKEGSPKLESLELPRLGRPSPERKQGYESPFQNQAAENRSVDHGQGDLSIDELRASIYQLESQVELIEDVLASKKLVSIGLVKNLEKLIAECTEAEKALANTVKDNENTKGEINAKTAAIEQNKHKLEHKKKELAHLGLLELP